MVVCVGGSCKMVNFVLGSWLKDVRCGFLLRLRRAWEPDPEFDGVFGMLPPSDSFSSNGFAFRKLSL